MIGIKIENLKRKLRQNQAIAGITLNFTEGNLHGLIGPEGAGKTTLLRVLLGLLSPDEGKIEYTQNGELIDFEDIRPSLAYMPEKQNLYPDLSIAEHLLFFKRLYSISNEHFEKKREELLYLTRLKKFEDRPASKLSGGMYKKLGLMCALLRSPQAVLLDEPTNGVDPISRREFWELLENLHKEKILIILATSYMDEASRCKEVHLLELGKIIASGTPEKLLETEGVNNFDALFIKRGQHHEFI